MEKNYKKILGIDPSIRSTGLCLWDVESNSHKYFLIASPVTKKLQQFQHPQFRLATYEHAEVKGLSSIGKERAITSNIESVAQVIEQIIIIYKPDAVVMEGVAFAAGGRVADLAMLNGVIRHIVIQHDIPVYVVPSTSNKMHFIGNGQATKDMMIEGWKRMDPVANEFNIKKLDDLADAFSLAHYPEDKLTLV